MLREAVGAEGHVYGVDLSEGMLAKAKRLVAQRKWDNVTLINSDAAGYAAPEIVDGVIFSLSYATMPHHLEVLRHAWNQLRPEKLLVIMDARLPAGIRGKLLRPLTLWMMKLTVLGNPDLRPWDELRELTADFGHAGDDVRHILHLSRKEICSADSNLEELSFDLPHQPAIEFLL